MTHTEFRVAPAVPDLRTVTDSVRAATRAPSVHNTQPWRWVLDGPRLHLFGDNDRRLFATDPHGREWTISCGAALHHVRTAFAARGWYTDTVRLPDQDTPDLLATIRFHPAHPPTSRVLAHEKAIEHRYSDRLPLLDPADWERQVPMLRELAANHGSTLYALNGSAAAVLSSASVRATLMRRYDAMYGEELDGWTGHSGTTEGIPSDALPSAAEQSRVGVARTFPFAPHSSRRDGLDDRARLIVLASSDDTVNQWLHVGEALSAILLECTALGFATCALTHLTEMPATRRVVAQLIPFRALPQVVVRVGAVPAEDQLPPRTPRRGVEDVLVVRGV